MKKILFLFIFCGLFEVVYGQQIYIDKIEEDGTRVICTQYVGIGKMGFGTSVSLICAGEMDQNLFVWAIDLNIPYYESHPQIDEGRFLLIKLKNGEIIELKNNTKIGPADYTYEVREYSTIYNVSPSYYLTEDNIKAIIEKGVEKLRVETNLGQNDIEVNKNRFSKAIKTSYELIKERFTIKKDKYSDF